VYIANGCSADDQVTAAGAVGDEDRIGYLDGHVGRCTRRCGSVDVRGCRLVADGQLEWTEGFHQRFGLVHGLQPSAAPQGLLRLVQDLIAAQHG
jgi:beta-glucosidase/6-phospho-beta-glucosidase/beta-galactosidase